VDGLEEGGIGNGQLFQGWCEQHQHEAIEAITDKHNSKGERLMEHMTQLDDLQKVTIGELMSFFGGPKALRESEPAFNTAKLAVASLSAVE
jgi:hypothetical protein